MKRTWRKDPGELGSERGAFRPKAEMASAQLVSWEHKLTRGGEFIWGFPAYRETLESKQCSTQ